MNATHETRARYRDALPQLADAPFLTDGGIETTLIFHDGLDLPHFAAYDLLNRDGGAQALRRYFDPYAEIARDSGVGIVLETATWRANSRHASKLVKFRSATAAGSRPASSAMPSRRFR